MGALVRYERRDRVARITLAAGDRGNPLTQPMVDDLARAVRRARADDVHVVVISADGPAFSFGGAHGPGGGRAPAARNGHSRGRGCPAPGDPVDPGPGGQSRRPRGRGRLPGEAAAGLSEQPGRRAACVALNGNAR
jgi:hypothetical protein